VQGVSKASLLALLVASAVLSGCTDGSEGPSPTDPTQGAPQPDGPFDTARAWVLGQWWTYTITNADNPSGSGPMTLVVTANGSSSYTLDTTDPGLSGFDAEFDVSYVGPIAKDDLSGSQGSDKVQFFQFPLAPGNQWNTTWDKVMRHILVGKVRGETIELEGHGPNGIEVKYAYDSKSGFFSHLEFFGADGSSRYAMHLNTWGLNYTGTYTRAAVKTLHSISGAGGPTAEGTTFMVEAGANELIARYSVNCTTAGGSWLLALAPADPTTAQAQAFEDQAQCPYNQSKTHTQVSPFVGTWAYHARWSFPDTAQVDKHSVTVVQRKYTTTNFP
jgi:hypothetical protein